MLDGLAAFLFQVIDVVEVTRARLERLLLSTESHNVRNALKQTVQVLEPNLRPAVDLLPCRLQVKIDLLFFVDPPLVIIPVDSGLV